MSDGVGTVVAMCGDEVGERDWGERAMRKTIGGGVCWELLDERMERQWEDEGVVITAGCQQEDGKY